MNRGMANRRMKRELELLSRGGAAPGIAAWARDEGARLDVLDAEIRGAADTPYEGGVFRLEVVIPSEYPLKPPRVRFLTRIYHPNIDSQGRICLDSLNMPPKGAWKPSLNVATLLTTVQALMSAPNADDGLMADITDEFRRNPGLFRQKAREWTTKYASGDAGRDGEEAADRVREGEDRGGDQPRIASSPERTAEEDAVENEDEITPAVVEPAGEGQGGSRLRKKARHR